MSDYVDKDGFRLPKRSVPAPPPLGSSREKEVKVFWDIDSVPVPAVQEIPGLRTRIRAALNTYDAGLYLADKVICYGLQTSINWAQHDALVASGFTVCLFKQRWTYCNDACLALILAKPQDPNPLPLFDQGVCKKAPLCELEMTKAILLHALSFATKSISSHHILIISGDGFFGEVHKKLREKSFESFIAMPPDSKLACFYKNPADLTQEESSQIWHCDALFRGEAALAPPVEA